MICGFTEWFLEIKICISQTVGIACVLINAKSKGHPESANGLYFAILSGTIGIYFSHAFGTYLFADSLYFPILFL